MLGLLEDHARKMISEVCLSYPNELLRRNKRGIKMNVEVILEPSLKPIDCFQPTAKFIGWIIQRDPRMDFK